MFLTHNRQRWLLVGLVTLGLVALLVALQPLALAQAQAQPQLRLLRSDANRIVFELELSAYRVRQETHDGATYLALSIDGLGRTSEVGKPQLPVKGAMLAVPPGAQASLKILSDESRTDSIAVPPLPVPVAQIDDDPSQPLPSYVGSAFVPGPAAYSANQFYPAEAARITSEGNWRSQHYVAVEFHPLQYHAATQQLAFHRLVRLELTLSYAPGSSAASLGGAVDEGPFEEILQQSLLNYSSAKNWRVKNNPLNLPQPQAYSASGPWYKVAVNAEGMYQITCAQLASAGINLSSLDPRTLKIFKQGVELAIDVIGQDDGRCDSGDYLLFFGQPARTIYADTNIYWLTFGGALGKRMVQRSGSGAGTLATTFTRTLHIEQDKWYIGYMPYAENTDHWYWNWLPDSYDNDGNGDVPSADYTFRAEQLAAGNFTATLQFKLHGYTFGNHRTLVYVNGKLVDDTSWSDRVERIAAVTFPQSYLTALTNTIRISEAASFDRSIYVNNFDLSYTSAFRATNNLLRFRQGATGAWQYQIGNFSTSDVETFDMADPLNVARMVNTTITPDGSTYTLQFADAISTPREYLALTAAQRKSPLSITLDTPSNWRGTANGADYLIIAHSAFITEVQRLASYRAAQGLRVQLVDVQDVYDEFSDGVLHAQAIRDFLAYAYANWQSPAPSFVLLVGDGTFDFKNNTGMAEPTFIPPYLRFVDPWLGETASDNQLVAFNADNTLPNMAIGRLPADSAADVAAMVSKIIAYEQNADPGKSPRQGDWRKTVAFVADNTYQADGSPDPAGDFWALSDQIADNSLYVPAAYGVDKIYFNPCDPVQFSQCARSYVPYTTTAAVRTGIVKAINDGHLIVNYIGHSGVQYWAHEQLFRIAEVNTLSNTNKLAIMLAMTCLDGSFHYPGMPSIAETNLRLPGRGAVASWSATGLGVATGHDFLDRGFLSAVMQQGVRRIGPATVLGKVNLWMNGGGGNRDLIDTFNLLGDPALRVLLPLPNRAYLPSIWR